MICKFNDKDIDMIITLGQGIDENFAKVFNINNLPTKERIYVYKENDQVIGFIHILINIDGVEILNLIVGEANRQQGIATILLDYVLSEPRINTNKIILEVRASNVAAIKLYEKFNFYVVNTRKNYYGNEDAIVMERSNNE